MRANRDEKLFTLARSLVEGKAVEQAMLDAGYAPGAAKGRVIRYTDENGERQKEAPHKHPQVAAYIKQLKAEGRRHTGVTIYSLTEKLMAVYDGATEDRQWGPAQQAVMGIAKLNGLIVDRKQHEFPPIDQWTEEQCLAALGESDAAPSVH